MRILLVSQYFWPEEFRINELSAMLAGRRHKITVLTGVPNYPGGKYFAGYGFVRHLRDSFHGIDVIRVPLIARGNGNKTRLMLNFLSFAVLASILGPMRCRDGYDLIFVYEPSPVTVGIPAIIMKKIKKVPIFFWVQDLWPESLVATDAVRSRRIIRLVEKLVSFIYSRCDRILVQSRNFIGPIVKMGIDPEKIRYFPNTAESIFNGVTGGPELPEHITFPEGFRIMFAGNIGASQDFETIIEAADILKDRSDIHWLIVGDGRMYPWVEQEVKARKLQGTVHLLGRHPLALMPAFYKRADFMLVTLKKDPVFSLTVPAKVQSYLACSRPVIAALDGEGARVIEEARAGLTCPAENPQMLAGTVLKACGILSTERDKMGASGRLYFEQNFESGMLLDSLEAWFSECSA